MAHPAPPSSTRQYLDLHDLATWILHAHATVIGTPFALSRLVEYNQNGAPFQSLDPNRVPAHWSDPAGPRRKVAYVLEDPPRRTAKITAVDTFVCPESGVITPNYGPLTWRETEDIFWRCKDHNQGSPLAYVTQCVFELLSKNGVWLLARTSTGYQLALHPTQLRVGIAIVTPHEACLIIHKPRATHLSGFDGPIRWPYLVLGSDPDVDKRVVLDLALPQIGGRGLGGELFALERHDDYMRHVLPLYAQIHSVEPLEMGIVPPSAAEGARAKALTEAVARRMQAIGRREDVFCRHCGQPDTLTQCTYCRVDFCAPCIDLGWRYHQQWCSVLNG